MDGSGEDAFHLTYNHHLGLLGVAASELSCDGMRDKHTITPIYNLIPSRDSLAGWLIEYHLLNNDQWRMMRKSSSVFALHRRTAISVIKSGVHMHLICINE